jgi:hypothetical protein
MISGHAAHMGKRRYAKALKERNFLGNVWDDIKINLGTVIYE